MPKKQFLKQLSIEEAQGAAMDYEDEHYRESYDLLFNQLLINIKQIPFERIIQNDLQYGNTVHYNKEAHSLVWLYTADRKVIDKLMVYSFRFGNDCNPEFYRNFETKFHHLFLPVPGIRHKYDGWYECIGRELLDYVDEYLNIERIVQNRIPHKTRLFIHQEQERIDIQFNFSSIHARITITFEPGYPEFRRP
ncbi:unnamed protein product [Rotaria sordida]|uniref:Uncharacterized protein n=2 Tax=Rotaria sordida TaxID=392033 RepID=A0A819V6W0_9BILA|nr:unnamed protein product [Rotaria sordida]CAF4104493.1 unnamed protein product [Rotaria sordida]